MRKKLFEVHFINESNESRKLYYYAKTPHHALSIFYKDKESALCCVTKVVRKAITYGEEGGIR